MNKTDLINAVAEKSELSKKDSGNAVEAVLETITKSLANDEEVRLIGFGTFKSKLRAARTARNPQSGESVEVPEKRVPSFKAGKALKDTVAKG